MKLPQSGDDLGRREPEFLDQFRAFCQLLTVCRKRAAALNLQDTSDAGIGEAQAIRAMLLDALEAQGRRASRESGPYGYELYREVQYVEAVLADEFFLSFDWPGRDFWASRILEGQLFGTHTAGDVFFVRIESLLRDRNAGPEGLELLYFMGLALGFQGKYRDRQDLAALTRYKRELYRRYYFKNPTGVQHLQYAFPECYEHTLDSFVPRRLPSPARWIAVFVSAIILWLIVTQVVWFRLTHTLRESMDSINQSNGSVSAGVAGGR